MVNALHGFEDLDDNTFESWLQHRGAIQFATGMPDDRAICEIAQHKTPEY